MEAGYNLAEVEDIIEVVYDPGRSGGYNRGCI